MNPYIETISSDKPEIRNRPFNSILEKSSAGEILNNLIGLEQFRKESTNLYDKVRSCIFLYAGFNHLIYKAKDFRNTGFVPYEGYIHLLERRFEESIKLFLNELKNNEPNKAIFSALSKTYHLLSFKILADQVRKSVRYSIGNRWMFRAGHLEDHSIRIHPKLLDKKKGEVLFPLLEETTPVRLDLSHSGWSDIFFLGMDYPEGANVINISVDLGVYGRDEFIKPPVQSFVRVIQEPMIRLTSIDLNTTKDVTELSDLFNFGNDYLSLLKAGIIASGFIPPAFEGTNQDLGEILAGIVGSGMGIELVTSVNDIPKGSRLAVSTNLLASIISCLMRATQQTRQLEGSLDENERRLVASRAILGEWLGGSGGGWQDSGGVWPGIKIIRGEEAKPGDPEYQVSKGCLLPRHTLLTEENLGNNLYEKLSDSLVVFHGGMAQNVGPILEMVTERYLLRSEKEWISRQDGNEIFNKILDSLRKGDIKELASHIMANWEGPLKTIIPWVSNKYTETLIERAKKLLGKDFYGFLMLGGMSGGGMGMFVNPAKKDFFKKEFQKILLQTKKELEHSMPFAMDPIIYDFAINRKGTNGKYKTAEDALLPPRYYELLAANLVKKDIRSLSPLRKLEINYYTSLNKDPKLNSKLLRTLVGSIFKVEDQGAGKEILEEDKKTRQIKEENGFDSKQHEHLRESLIRGRIGLSRNRLPDDTLIEDVNASDFYKPSGNQELIRKGELAIKNQEIAILSLAAGVGSRWTKGAGVIKAINPFVKMAGDHYDFLGVHIKKTSGTIKKYGIKIPNIVATSYLTGEYIQEHLKRNKNYDSDCPVYISHGKSIGQRFIPMVRDLVFLWEELSEEILDEQKQKVREATRYALQEWAKSNGEGNDYVNNIASQRLSPMGHWYEVSNLFRNGKLKELLSDFPSLKTLLLHNIDTLGVNIDPEIYAWHLQSGNTLSFEVIPRLLEDRGGGLAKVNGKARLLEGLAQPREEDEFRLRYYNTMTTWIDIDKLLKLFGLDREKLMGPQEEIDKAVRNVARQMPTYVTIKDVKFRWGHGQEDIYPVAQMEKLWSDMSALNQLKVGYIAVPRLRGQQLKDADQLDNWYHNGSKDYIEKLIK